MKQLSEQMGTCPECGYVGSIGYTQGKHVPTGSQCLQRQLGNQCIENTKLRKALQAVLEFHDGAEWTLQKGLLWARLTGSSEATTKVLCDTVRKALAIKEARG